jgi:hypothetical protein
MLMIPQQKEEPGLVSDNGFKHPATPTGQKATSYTRDLSGYSSLVSDLEIANFFDLTPILVTERDVIQQVFDCRYAKPGQLLRATRANAFDVLNRLLERRLG